MSMMGSFKSCLEASYPSFSNEGRFLDYLFLLGLVLGFLVGLELGSVRSLGLVKIPCFLK